MLSCSCITPAPCVSAPRVASPFAQRGAGSQTQPAVRFLAVCYSHYPCAIPLCGLGSSLHNPLHCWGSTLQQALASTAELQFTHKKPKPYLNCWVVDEAF